MEDNILSVEEAKEILEIKGEEILKEFRETIRIMESAMVRPSEFDYSYFNEDNLPQILVDGYLYCIEIEEEVERKYGEEVIREYNLRKISKAIFKDDPIRNIIPYFSKITFELLHSP